MKKEALPEGIADKEGKEGNGSSQCSVNTHVFSLREAKTLIRPKG
jgi:hypothetical protein